MKSRRFITLPFTPEGYRFQLHLAETGTITSSARASSVAPRQTTRRRLITRRLPGIQRLLEPFEHHMRTAGFKDRRNCTGADPNPLTGCMPWTPFGMSLTLLK